jgi:hypothetical protein
MRVLTAVLALGLGGCASVTFNGQDIGRVTAASAIVAIGAALIFAEDEDDDADKHSRCPSCPPFEPVE